MIKCNAWKPTCRIAWNVDCKNWAYWHRKYQLPPWKLLVKSSPTDIVRHSYQIWKTPRNRKILHFSALSSPFNLLKVIHGRYIWLKVGGRRTAAWMASACNPRWHRCNWADQGGCRVSGFPIVVRFFLSSLPGHYRCSKFRLPPTGSLLKFQVFMRSMDEVKFIFP